MVIIDLSIDRTRLIIPFVFLKMKKDNIDNQNVGKRKKVSLKKVFAVLGIVAVISALSFFTYILINNHYKNKITIKTLKEKWNEYDYSGLYETGKAFLQDNPYNNTALTYYSYACFYLAVSQNDTFQAQEYLDECINNLRLALYNANKSLVPQLQYMLGKAYFYKNTISTYYYADLAVKYLNLAKENGYKADDIPEYLGLSYASLGMTMESISAFTEALLVRESDALLLSIAEQYYKTKEYNAAEQYLFRVTTNSENDEIITKSKILLGNIYIDKEDYDNAFKVFNELIEQNDNCADAHYGIGIIYEKQNNMVKARAEWRKTLKIQVNHQGAIKKLSNN